VSKQRGGKKMIHIVKESVEITSGLEKAKREILAIRISSVSALQW